MKGCVNLIDTTAATALALLTADCRAHVRQGSGSFTENNTEGLISVDSQLLRQLSFQPTKTLSNFTEFFIEFQGQFVSMNCLLFPEIKGFERNEINVKYDESDGSKFCCFNQKQSKR